MRPEPPVIAPDSLAAAPRRPDPGADGRGERRLVRLAHKAVRGTARGSFRHRAGAGSPRRRLFVRLAHKQVFGSAGTVE
jgi:hypothetical protein